MGEQHHHFMQWRVISSERRFRPSGGGGNGSPTKYFLTPESGRKYLATFPLFLPLFFDRRRRRRRSPRIPFCSEFCDQAGSSLGGRSVDATAIVIARPENSFGAMLPRVPDLVERPSFLPAALGRLAGRCSVARALNGGRDDGFRPTVATVVAGGAEAGEAGEGFVRPVVPPGLIFVRMASTLLSSPLLPSLALSSDHNPQIVK